MKIQTNVVWLWWETSCIGNVVLILSRQLTMPWLLNWWFMLWLQYSPYRGCSFSSLFPGPSWSSSRGTRNDQSCGVCADRPCCCSCCGLFPEREKCEVHQGEEEKVEEKRFFEQWLTLLPPLLLLDLSLLSRLLLRLRSLVSVTYTIGQCTYTGCPRKKVADRILLKHQLLTPLATVNLDWTGETPSLVILLFWSFLTRTKQDQALPERIHT